VDNTEITCVSLCSGYEGLGLGLKRVAPNLRTILYSEIELYVCEVLVDLMEKGEIDAAPIWTDLKTLSGEDFRGKVDFVTAGYPCPPFSCAGKRKGKEDPRHLWPHIKRIIGEIEPRGVFFENVEGHVSLGGPEVLSDLEAMGFRVEAGIFSAAEVGAPHQRKRLFILGHSDESGLEGRHGGILRERVDEQIARSGGSSICKWPARPGQEQFEWEEPRVI
jgi:DNA (cytosine-5)-methyltransferase 1